MSYAIMIVKLLFCGVATFILKFLFEYVYTKYKFRKVPAVEGLPFIGIVWDLLSIPSEDQIEWFSNISKKFNGNVFVTWIGTEPFINIQKPNHMEVLLASTVNIKKSTIYDMLIPWLGNGLLTSNGKTWLHHRRLLTPAFHFGILEQFNEIIVEKAEILNDCLKKQVFAYPEKSIDILSFASKFTLDVICKTAMGIETDAQTGSMSAYSAAVEEVSNLLMHRFVRPWYMSDFIYSKTEDGQKFKAAIKVMHDFGLKVIKDKLDKKRTLNSFKEEDEEDEFGIKRKRKAFLDLLLEASENDKHPLSIDEIRNQVDTFMFAVRLSINEIFVDPLEKNPAINQGYDTTATAISWALFSLGNELDVQKKVHEELQTIFDNDDHKPLRTADLIQLKYLDRVMKETLRLYPSAPFVFRELSEEVVFDGYKFPEGSSVIVNIYDLHRDPELWKNPTVFDPDRFLPENLKGKHPYSYIPFSAGPRNCIGQKFAQLEMKIALTTILRKWRVKSVRSPEEIKLQSGIVLRCFEGIKLHFTPLD